MKKKLSKFSEELSKISGLTVALLEASNGVGGRVRTDKVDGFLLDRGFQIFLTGYPSAHAELDYDALKLQPFYAGALVYFQGSWHRCASCCPRQCCVGCLHYCKNRSHS
jgi:hypothetical protein